MMGRTADPSVVLTTTPTLKSIVSEWLPESIRVESLVDGSQDPHHLEIDTKHVLLAKRAKLVIAIGLDFEDSWLTKLLKASAPKTKVFYVGDRLDATISMGGHLHERHKINPHFLQSPNSILEFSDKLHLELVKLYPEEKSVIDRKYASFIKKLNEKNIEWAGKFKGLSNKKIITYHENLEYFSKNNGLDVVSHIESAHGVSPSPLHIKKLFQIIKNENIKCIVYDSNFSSEQLKKSRKLFSDAIQWVPVPSEVGADSDASTYFLWVDKIVSQIKSCLN
ncbi:MAG: zinc ABC transporter substrate-binding protein [Bdellovibrionales bacterium]|nr:zinc ABC transporter substrate-binding protein [Bdellovibrionales bacterium]